MSEETRIGRRYTKQCRVLTLILKLDFQCKEASGKYYPFSFPF